VFGETPAMNAIFVDSLQRHCNVCDGCFKTIYTLSIKLALEKNIPYIVTGLSRGQFFETRLTEELFTKEDFDADEIDEIILQARKAYHQVDDAVKELMDVSMFADDEVFERVKFVDFYRFTDVSLDQMLDYLDTRVPWIRPTDTGRSTNCLINQAGIFVHKKERGYSNYAFPYSWDVRIGHKTRAASLDEINEYIDEEEVETILDEIGYNQAQEDHVQASQLVAYYTATEEVDEKELRNYLASLLPDYMLPVQYIHLEALPLTINGKIDHDALPQPDSIRPVLQVDYVAPRSDMEEMIAGLWSEILGINKIGVFDNFIKIGGDSLSGIRLMAKLNETFELDLPINVIFEKTSVASMSTYVEEVITKLLAEMDQSE
jgi:acyl carrier protein